MAVYLIDFENVHSAGLSGIERLTEKDCVYIFYSINSNSITFEAHELLMSSKARIVPLLISCGGKNALDFQLSSFIGYLAGASEDRELYVISLDKGYCFVQTFWEKTMRCTNFNIKFSPSIRKCLPPDIREIKDPVTAGRAVFEKKDDENSDKFVIIPDEDPIDTPVQADENVPVNDNPEAAEENIPENEEALARLPENIPETENDPATENITAAENAVIETMAEDASESTEPVTEATADIIEAQATANKKPKAKAAKPTEKAPAKSAKAKPSKEAAARIKQGKTELTAIISSAGIENVNTNLICELVSSSKDKQQFYTGMTKAFGMEAGLKIYKSLKPEYLNLKKLLQAT